MGETAIHWQCNYHLENKLSSPTDSSENGSSDHSTQNHVRWPKLHCFSSVPRVKEKNKTKQNTSVKKPQYKAVLLLRPYCTDSALIASRAPETLSSAQELVAESHLAAAAAAALAAELRHGFKDGAWSERCASDLMNDSG